MHQEYDFDMLMQDIYDLNIKKGCLELQVFLGYRFKEIIIKFGMVRPLLFFLTFASIRYLRIVFGCHNYAYQRVTIVSL